MKIHVGGSFRAARLHISCEKSGDTILGLTNTDYCCENMLDAVAIRRMIRVDTVCMAKYHTSQVARIVGVAPITLKRALLAGRIDDVARDRNDWRVFTDEDVERIRLYFATTRPPVTLPLFKGNRR